MLLVSYLNQLTFNCLCTILGLFLGLLGGLVPTKAQKSCSTSSLERETENLTLSFPVTTIFFFSFTGGKEQHPTSKNRRSSSFCGALHAALLVLKFQGIMALVATPLASSLSPPKKTASPSFILRLLVTRATSFWGASNLEDRRSRSALTQRSNRWVPHFKQGNEKLCSGFDLSGPVAIDETMITLKKKLNFSIPRWVFLLGVYLCVCEVLWVLFFLCGVFQAVFLGLKERMNDGVEFELNLQREWRFEWFENWELKMENELICLLCYVCIIMITNMKGWTNDRDRHNRDTRERERERFRPD